jgi:hypothetical protein
MKLPKLNRKVIVVGLGLALILAGGGYAYTRTLNQPDNHTVTQPSTQTPAPTTASPAPPSPSTTTGPTPTPTTTPQPTPSKYFTLAGDATVDGVQLDWDVAGYDVSQGFKLAIDNSTTGTFSNFKYLSSPTVRSALWKVGDGQTRYFKICGYHKDAGNAVSGTTACSNVISLDTNNVAAETSGSITLLPSTSNGGFHWITEGYAPYGFRLVWAADANPVYPADQSQSFQPVWSNASSGSIPNTTGTWYVEACMITATQACNNYSDEKTITIQ